MGLKGYNIGEGGEIVEVQGGHIIRPTGLKDRHSKVLTSKGPRDRRVRLSAHTAIQFYDVQDRLGYDRPSKAVDWLIKKAKTAIERLGETTTITRQELGSPNLVDQTQFMEVNLDPEEDNNIVSRTRTTTTPNFSQDLGLSLHSFQGNNNVETNNFTTNHFETLGRISGWNHHQDLTMRSSSSSSEQEERSNNGGFIVNHQFHQQQVFLDGQQQQQRGTLQSSLFHQMTPDHHHHHHHHYHNQTSPVMFASSAQYGSHGMMMMQGLSFPNTSRLLHGEEANQPNTSSSSSTPPNSHL